MREPCLFLLHRCKSEEDQVRSRSLCLDQLPGARPWRWNLAEGGSETDLGNFRVRYVAYLVALSAHWNCISRGVLQFYYYSAKSTRCMHADSRLPRCATLPSSPRSLHHRKRSARLRRRGDSREETSGTETTIRLRATVKKWIPTRRPR